MAHRRAKLERDRALDTQIPDKSPKREVEVVFGMPGTPPALLRDTDAPSAWPDTDPPVGTGSAPAASAANPLGTPRRMKAPNMNDKLAHKNLSPLTRTFAPRFSAALLMLAGTFTLTACPEEEKTAGEKIGDKIEDAGDKVGGKMDQAGEKVEDALDNN